MAREWDYKIVRIDVSQINRGEEALNALDSEGWQFVAPLNNTVWSGVIFRRPHVEPIQHTDDSAPSAEAMAEAIPEVIEEVRSRSKRKTTNHKLWK